MIGSDIGLSVPGMLLGGRLVAGHDKISVENPSLSAWLADAPMASVAQLDAAITAAERQAGWAYDPEQRRIVLQQCAAVVAENRDRLAHLLALEIGLPITVAGDEVSAAAGFFAYRAQKALTAEVLYDDARQHVEVVRTAIGIVGAIIPWNAPLLIACEKIATAFAAGNSVIVKPSPLAPLTLLALGEVLAPVVPAGVLAILPGTAELGAAMVAHRNIGMISFTGSTRGGQAIMANGAATLKRLSLELGGNDAAIVLEDADIPSLAPRIFAGAFYRTGQICAAIKRLYVHESRLAEMIAALQVLAEASVPGDPFAAGVTMGPLSNRQQFGIVQDLIAAAVAGGGRVVSGGRALDRVGYFLPPTLVTGLAEDNRLVAEEQFGPALPILSFSTLDAAVAAANDTPFGLGASVWTADVERGVATARRLRTGSVWVNRHGLVLPDIPFGGMKLSGLGRANGAVGLDSYAELQTVSVAKSRPAKA
jgi:acyl-CoA reductase-like NAD-dependent aldehyde dehydrogenase